MSLTDSRILLGVSGGIAAYKSASLVRRLKEAGADVRVVMTAAAQTFVAPLTFQAVSGNAVHTQLLDPNAEAGMGHIELARWADLMLVTPASADVIARIVHGIADDLLTTLILARRCPLAVAPAMNQAMWGNAATQANIQRLNDLDIACLGPASGSQACGDQGPGRLLEEEDILQAVYKLLRPKPQKLAGKTVMITAGPTREAIDPVRYISNHSSGKMGYALAQAAATAGAHVILVSGPTQLATPATVTRINTVSAGEMHEQVMANLAGVDVFIGCAAVADYRPAEVATAKIKKTENNNLQITMIKNPDIIADVAGVTTPPFTVGFAAETNDVEHYAQDKLARKKLNMVIANDVSRSDIGFNADENEVLVFWPGGQQALAQQSKAQLAAALIDTIAERAFSAQIDQ